MRRSIQQSQSRKSVFAQRMVKLVLTHAKLYPYLNVYSRGLGNVGQIEELLNRLIGKSLLLLKEDCIFIIF